MGSLIQSLSRVLHPQHPNSAALDFTWLTIQPAKYACTYMYVLNIKVQLCVFDLPLKSKARVWLPGIPLLTNLTRVGLEKNQYSF